MTWVLTKEFRFEAAHLLPNHDGKCARLHGHSWRAIVYVSGISLDTEGAKQGMVLDYADIKKVVEPIVDQYLDHHYLNGTLDLIAPTSEAIAQWLYKKIIQHLPNLIGVTICETCTSSCFYTERTQLDLSSISGVLGG